MAALRHMMRNIHDHHPRFEVDAPCPVPRENTLGPSPCPLLIRIFPLDGHR